MKLLPDVKTLKPLLFSAVGAVIADYAIKEVEKYATAHSSEGIGKFLAENAWSPYAVVAVGGLLLLNYQKELGSGIFVVSVAQLISSFLVKE